MCVTSDSRLLHTNSYMSFDRFHLTVTESLESHTADVIEIRQPMTKSMKAIQASIIDCMDVCLQELRRSSSAVRDLFRKSILNLLVLVSDQLLIIFFQIEIDVDDFTVEKAMFKSFDVIIRRQLDPIWHRVSAKTKHLVSDLKTLRSLLSYLVSYDSVNFNLYLETILATFSSTSSSYWIMTDPADKIYTVRVSTFHESRSRSELCLMAPYTSDFEI